MLLLMVQHYPHQRKKENINKATLFRKYNRMQIALRMARRRTHFSPHQHHSPWQQFSRFAKKMTSLIAETTQKPSCDGLKSCESRCDDDLYLFLEIFGRVPPRSQRLTVLIWRIYGCFFSCTLANVKTSPLEVHIRLQFYFYLIYEYCSRG